jgi:hypothetical protein
MGQGVQNWLPAVPEKRPGGHNAQARASIVVPRSTPYFPGRHCPGHTGILLPTPGLYVPKGHGTQSAEEFLPKNAFVVPAGQKLTLPTSTAATAPFASKATTRAAAPVGVVELTGQK